MKRHTIAAAMMLLAQQGTASAQPEASANFTMPGCRSAVANNAGTWDLATLQGYCTGVIASVYWLGRDHLGICSPKESNIGQAIRVVVAYIDARPARMHENFLALTHEALQKAWPCRR